MFCAAVMQHVMAGTYWDQIGLDNKINNLTERRQIGRIHPLPKEIVPQLVEVAGQFLVAEEGLEPPTRGL